MAFFIELAGLYLPRRQQNHSHCWIGQSFLTFLFFIFGKREFLKTYWYIFSQYPPASLSSLFHITWHSIRWKNWNKPEEGWKLGVLNEVEQPCKFRNIFKHVIKGELSCANCLQMWIDNTKHSVNYFSKRKLYTQVTVSNNFHCIFLEAS